VKRLLLIGDSIRLGYEEYVRRELGDGAEVFSFPENGGTSANVLANLDRWVLASQPDVLHLNCGLHDLRREFGAADNAVPLAAYEENLETLFSRIRDETRATLVWATTTPVHEGRHHATKGFDRFEADVVAYNAAALRVARRHGLPIDDLYAVVMAAGRDRLLLPDGVHYTPEGYALLGAAVAAAVRPHLEE
jgi:lysophospholipase L1-like esterase